VSGLAAHCYTNQGAAEHTDGNGPVHQDQINVVGSETLERLVDNFGNILVLHVVNLGGQEDLLSGNTGVLDTGTDLGLVTVSLSADRGVVEPTDYCAEM
jgi:hypothetical protein